MGIYEFNGEKYKQASKHQKEWGNKLIVELRLKGDEHILDLGCGDGALTEELATLVQDGFVTGIDASAGMIETAKKHVKNNLTFLRMDINNINYINKFDVIFSNAALHWVQNHEKLLQNSFVALKPNGRILWNFAGSGNCANFYEVIRKTIKEDKYKKYFIDFKWPWFMPSKSEYEKLVKPIGFSKIEITEENADRYFANADEIIRWIDQPSIVPFLTCVPDNAKDEFRNEVVNEMLQKTMQHDGTCFETFRRIKVNAVK